jgi:hypothetical protein
VGSTSAIRELDNVRCRKEGVMGVTQMVFASLAAAAILSQFDGGGRGLSEDTSVVAPAARASAPISCVASGNLTVLEVGDDPNVDRKKIADDCWWQYPVPFLFGYVHEPLGWQLCNRCAVAVEFKLESLPPEALIGCNVFIDASNSFSQVVPAGGSHYVICSGGRVVDPPHHYNSKARVSGGQFVEDDPEIEIENRHGAAREFDVFLASTQALALCVTTMNQGPRRLTVSGEFAPQKSGASIGMVPTGPGPLSQTWGADLVETAAPTAAKVSELKFQKFSVNTDLPAYVTNFVLRDKTGPKGGIVVGQLAKCGNTGG